MIGEVLPMGEHVLMRMCSIPEGDMPIVLLLHLFIKSLILNNNGSSLITNSTNNMSIYIFNIQYSSSIK